MRKRSRRSVATEIAVLRRTLRRLDQSLRRLGPMLVASPSSEASSQNRTARRRPRLSAKSLAALKLQGRYMGYMRQLKPKLKAQVRKIREAKGVRAAISNARRLIEKQRAA